MTRTSKFTTFGLLAVLAGSTLAPAMADQQSDKNNLRNLAIGGGAVALYGLLNHNNTATLLGAAGAALAGSQYEKDRKNQSQNNDRYYYRSGDRNGYDRNGYDNSGYNRDGYNHDGYNRDGYNRDGYNRDNYNRDGIIGMALIGTATTVTGIAGTAIGAATETAGTTAAGTPIRAIPTSAIPTRAIPTSAITTRTAAMAGTGTPKAAVTPST